VPGRPDRDAVIISGVALPDQQGLADRVVIANGERQEGLEGISDIRDEKRPRRHADRDRTAVRETLPPGWCSTTLFKLTPLPRATSQRHMLALVNSEPIYCSPCGASLQVSSPSPVRTLERRHPLPATQARNATTSCWSLFRHLIHHSTTIIALIRAAADAATRVSNCRIRHGLSEIRPTPSCPDQLRRLTALEADKIRLELRGLWCHRIARLPDILAA